VCSLSFCPSTHIAQSAGGFKIPTAILDDEGNIVQEKLEEYIRERAIEQQVLKKWRSKCMRVFLNFFTLVMILWG
jgi:hypothetical protein